MLFFIEGDQTTSQQYYQNYALGVSTEGIILTGDQVASATAGSNRDEQGNLTNVVNLKFNDTGKRAFGDATSRLYASGGSISIWMDTVCISSPTVQAPLTDGEAVITGNFTAESAKKLADQINSGALPFALEVTSFKTISPTLGMGALDAMILASVISFALISIYMMFSYRLQGFVAAIGLLGQVAGILAFVSG
jgi:protein-export membrane protein SecD